MPNCSLDSSTTSLLSMMFTFGFRHGGKRNGKHLLRDFGGWHVHVLRLRMVEKGVLEDHQNDELDYDDDGKIANERRAMKPCGQAFQGAWTDRLRLTRCLHDCCHC